MDIEQKIKDALKTIVKDLFDVIIEDIHLEIPKDNSHGDYATNIAMSLAKDLKMNPREIAQRIVDAINNEKNFGLIEKVELAGPGFINFFISQDFFAGIYNNLINSPDLGDNLRLKGKRIMVEFAHPNPFKSFHIGHLRNIILGESIVRLIESQGAEVIRVNYQGDVGMHIAKCLWAFKEISPEEYPKDNDEKVKLLGKCYSQGASIFEEDENVKKEITAINKKIYSSIKKVNNNSQDLTEEEKVIYKLWETGRKWSLDKFRDIYKRVYSDKFVKEYMESEVMDTCIEFINEGVEKGILKKSDGAIVFDGSKYGLDTRVFLNSEGLPTYEGKELGLAYKEFTDYGDVDLCIHNVAIEQLSFFKVTFKVQELLNPQMYKGKQYHNAYEFVGLKSGKMSSRKGNVVLGEEVLNLANKKIHEFMLKKDEDVDKEVVEKISIGAVKYSFLKISPFTYLSFDIEESVSFEGNSGPYVQYTYARAMAVANKSKSDKFELANGVELEREELELLKHLLIFNDKVEKASLDYSPNIISTYLYELTQIFNTFYNNTKIIGSEREGFRIGLSLFTAKVIKKGLYLLGIETVERM